MATPPDFSVGQVLTAAHMDAVGLWLVKTDTITSVASIEITGLFSADFRNYLILLDNVKLSAAGIVRMQMGTTGGTAYYFSGAQINYSSGTLTTEIGNGGAHWFVSAVADTKSASAAITLFSPNEATETSYESRGTDVRVGGGGLRSYSGFLNNTTAYTSVTLSNSGAGTFTSCNVSVYGYTP